MAGKEQTTPYGLKDISLMDMPEGRHKSNRGGMWRQKAPFNLIHFKWARETLFGVSQHRKRVHHWTGDYLGMWRHRYDHWTRSSTLYDRWPRPWACTSLHVHPAHKDRDQNGLKDIGPK